MTTYFQGIWRMDWGLGNPNKTAALIAMLMIAVWLLAYLRRWAFWVTIPLFTGLGVCLVHTFSRGGIIAACVGAAVLILKAPRPWPATRVTAIATSVWVIIGASVYLDATTRFSRGITQEDKSITNRLEIWKTTPRMMLDAPNGWGLGNSGRAYVQWYQSDAQNEEYRTLVSSHLTWLVELPWPLRFLYLTAWAAIFVLCFSRENVSWLGVPFAMWVTFCIAALFSSVAECIWLWPVPTIFAIAALTSRVYSHNLPSAASWCFPPVFALSALIALTLVGMTWEGNRVSFDDGIVKLGSGQPRIWILASPTVFGSQPAKALRTYWKGLPQDKKVTTAYVESADAIRGLSGGTLVLGGALRARDLTAIKEVFERCDRIIMLNPSFSPRVLEHTPDVRGRVHVVFGEFSQSPFAIEWHNYSGPSQKHIEGAGDFLPDWPALSLSDSLFLRDEAVQLSDSI